MEINSSEQEYDSEKKKFVEASLTDNSKQIESTDEKEVDKHRERLKREAEIIFDEALRYFDDLAYDLDMQNRQIQIALVSLPETKAQEITGRIEEAERAFSPTATEEGYREGSAEVENELRITEGDLPVLLTAEQAFARLADAAGLAEVATNIVETLALLDPIRALDAAPFAMKANEQAGHRLEIGKIHTATAQAHLCLNDGEAASTAIGDAIDALENVGYRSGRARAVLTRGFVSAHAGDVEEVVRDASQAVEEFIAVDVYPTLVIVADMLCISVGERGAVSAQHIEAAKAALTLPNGCTGLEERLDAAVRRMLGR